MFFLSTAPLCTGVSGNVLVNDDADRVNSYNVWNCALVMESSLHSAMLRLVVDLN